MFVNLFKLLLYTAKNRSYFKLLIIITSSAYITLMNICYDVTYILIYISCCINCLPYSSECFISVRGSLCASASASVSVFLCLLPYFPCSFNSITLKLKGRMSEYVWQKLSFSPGKEILTQVKGTASFHLYFCLSHQRREEETVTEGLK